VTSKKAKNTKGQGWVVGGWVQAKKNTNNDELKV